MQYLFLSVNFMHEVSPAVTLACNIQDVELQFRQSNTDKLGRSMKIFSSLIDLILFHYFRQ